MGTHPIFESDFDCIQKNKKMKILGPKCSSFCLVVSAWGVVMFLLLGSFYHVKSPALRDDIVPANSTKEAVWAAYEANAYNCYITAAIYAGTLVFSVFQVYVNNNRSYQMV